MIAVRTCLAFLIVVIALSAACGQNRTYVWDETACQFEGIYDPKTLSAKQIEDTKKLIDHGMGLPLQTEFSASNNDEIAGLNVEALDNEYREKVEMLNGLQLGNSDYFESLRRDHLKALEQFYKLAKITLLTHKDPQALKEHTGNEKCFAKYGAPIVAGGDSLLEAWKRLNEEMRKDNASPDQMKAQFETRYESEDRLSFALLEVLNFGWWNCVNETIDYVPNEGRQEQEFKKLFISVKTVACDEP